MLETAIFDHLFIKSNISAMDNLSVVKFHITIATRWLFIVQRKIMAMILHSKSYFDMFRGPFFPDTVYVMIIIIIIRKFQMTQCHVVGGLA